MTRKAWLLVLYALAAWGLVVAVTSKTGVFG